MSQFVLLLFAWHVVWFVLPCIDECGLSLTVPLHSIRMIYIPADTAMPPCDGLDAQLDRSAGVRWP